MRADRLVSLALLLQARGRMSARGLAAELKVSVRTVYRDIAALNLAGVPVVTESGPGGGCWLLDGYRFPLRGLSGDEAEALLVLGVPAVVAELGLADSLAAAQQKIRVTTGASGASGAGGGAGGGTSGGAGGGASGSAGPVPALVHLDLPRWFVGGEPVPWLRTLATAVRGRRLLRIGYRRGERDGVRGARAAGWSARSGWSTRPGSGTWSPRPPPRQPPRQPLRPAPRPPPRLRLGATRRTARRAGIRPSSAWAGSARWRCCRGSSPGHRTLTWRRSGAALVGLVHNQPAQARRAGSGVGGRARGVPRGFRQRRPGRRLTRRRPPTGADSVRWRSPSSTRRPQCSACAGSEGSRGAVSLGRAGPAHRDGPRAAPTLRSGRVSQREPIGRGQTHRRASMLSPGSRRCYGRRPWPEIYAGNAEFLSSLARWRLGEKSDIRRVTR